MNWRLLILDLYSVLLWLLWRRSHLAFMLLILARWLFISPDRIFLYSKLRTRVMIEVVIARDTHFIFVAVDPTRPNHIVFFRRGLASWFEFFMHQIVVLAKFKQTLLVLSYQGVTWWWHAREILLLLLIFRVIILERDVFLLWLHLALHNALLLVIRVLTLLRSLSNWLLIYLLLGHLRIWREFLERLLIVILWNISLSRTHGRVVGVLSKVLLVGDGLHRVHCRLLTVTILEMRLVKGLLGMLLVHLLLLVRLRAHTMDRLVHGFGILPEINIESRSWILSKIRKGGLIRGVPRHHSVVLTISIGISSLKQLLVLCSISYERLLLVRFVKIIIIKHPSIWVHWLRVLMV